MRISRGDEELTVSSDRRYVKVASGSIVAKDRMALNEYRRKKENNDICHLPYKYILIEYAK